MESVIKWRTGEPKEQKEEIYLVTLSNGCIAVSYWSNKDQWFFYTGNVIAWCPLSELTPYKENEEFKVGDIVSYEGPLTKGIMIIGSFDYGDGTKPEAARANIGESIHIRTGSSTIYSGFAPGINNIRHATDDEVIDFIKKEECQWYLNFYKDWLLKHCSRLVNLGLLNK